jgi:hypothetical protein
MIAIAYSLMVYGCCMALIRRLTGQKEWSFFAQLEYRMVSAAVAAVMFMYMLNWINHDSRGSIAQRNLQELVRLNSIREYEGVEMILTRLKEEEDKWAGYQYWDLHK